MVVVVVVVVVVVHVLVVVVGSGGDRCRILCWVNFRLRAKSAHVFWRCVVHVLPKCVII